MQEIPSHATLPGNPLATARGRVFWITGLSGSGKSAIGERLWRRLRASGVPTVFLDGDRLRKTIAEDLGHSSNDRKRSAMRNGRLCQMLSQQEIYVVCATISLFHDQQRWNRAHIPGYIEIHLRVPIAEIERRDPKSIYANARNAKEANVVGIDLPAEEPKEPDLEIKNYGEIDADTAVELIWSRFVEKIEKVRWGTKAETLARLESRLKTARILPQVCFSVSEWRAYPDGVVARLAAEPWGGGTLIVRSSAQSEDRRSGSEAGKFTSVLDVGPADLTGAVERVIESFADSEENHQIFVQPMLSNVSIAGVAFTRDLAAGGPYVAINYEAESGRTNLVTSGSAGDVETFYCLKTRLTTAPPRLAPIVRLLVELESLLGSDSLDVEFAIDKHGEAYLLQVRPLLVKAIGAALDADDFESAVTQIACKIDLLNRPHPYLLGKRTIFGVMPDWNPAEMLGLRPKPLALSLYKELITDSIWAYQRDNYGYKNLRSFPLMISFHGLPYIDVRVSFNSFIPRDVDHALSEKLVNYYISRLLAQPELHDKVEFEIVFSCCTLDLAERLIVLERHGFSKDEITSLSNSLCHLTNRVIHRETGLWHQDRQKIDMLSKRVGPIRDAAIDKIGRIYWLLEDCKRYGTLPFAGLARVGFIATQMLRSLIDAGVLSESEHTSFLANLETVGSRIWEDFASLSKTEFLERYGHLRPSSYDILSPRYDEAPDLYFDWASPRISRPTRPQFALTVPQLRQIEHLLGEYRLEHDVLGFIHFVKAGMEAREYGKFVFTRSLSDILALIKELGADHGITAEDCAFLDVAAIKNLYHESGAVGSRLRENISENKRRFALTQSLILPPLITTSDEVYSFHQPSSQPNYITLRSVTAAVAQISDPAESFAGKVLFIPSADPGFDWVFMRNIAGLVTKFGGANSHMAIRAAELDIPAVIGVGETQFLRWSSVKTIHLDCASRRVEALNELRCY